MGSRPVGYVKAPSRAVVGAITAALLFGAAAPLTKSLLVHLDPFTLAGLLYLGAAIGAAPLALRGGSAELRRDRVQRWRLAGAVFFGGVVAPVLLLCGLRLAPAASTSLWLNTEVLATAVLAAIWFHEPVGRRTALAVGLVVLGGVSLAIPGGAGWRAAAFVVGACVCWAIDNNLTALISGFTPGQTTTVKGLVAGSVNLTIGLALSRHLPEIIPAAKAIAIGMVCYGVSIVLYVSASQQLGATRSQLLFAVAPFFGALLSWTVLGEPVQSVQLLAAPCFAAGILLMLKERHSHEHVHVPLRHTHGHRHDDGHHRHTHPGLPASTWHTHPHEHEPVVHAHPHAPDLHHRHAHG